MSSSYLDGDRNTLYKLVEDSETGQNFIITLKAFDDIIIDIPGQNILRYGVEKPRAERSENVDTLRIVTPRWDFLVETNIEFFRAVYLKKMQNYYTLKNEAEKNYQAA